MMTLENALAPNPDVIFGYEKKEAAEYTVDVDTLVVAIARKLVDAGLKDAEVRIVDCESGAVIKCKGVDGILFYDWFDTVRVHLYDMHIAKYRDETWLVVVIADDVFKEMD